MTHAFDIKRGETSVFSWKNNSSFNANDDHDIFLNSRIRFLVRSRLVPCIDSV